MRACSVDGCQKPVDSRGLCPMHYRRWRLYGDPDAIRQIQGLSIADRFWAKVDKSGSVERTELGACWLWTAYRTRQGYGQFAIDRGGPRWRTEVAHRIAWELTYGSAPPDDVEVCHHCDNPPCCRPEHLFLGTTRDNARDRERKGRGHRTANRARGVDHGLAKLDDGLVREIRSRYASGGISQQALADEYGVNQSKISALIRRETWAHVD